MTATVISLARSRDLVAPALRAALDRLDEHSRRQALYHFGWSTADGRPVGVDTAAGGEVDGVPGAVDGVCSSVPIEVDGVHGGDLSTAVSGAVSSGGVSSGGKAVRAALALLSARAGGATVDIGLAGAIAVELVHNFSLLHDDLMDGDTRRRHRRTVWAVWGAAGAILTGDALLALAHEVVLESESPHAGAAGALLARATRELVRGQVLDLAFERRLDVTVADCLDMAGGKTGALLSASAAIGAVLAGAPGSMVSALAAFGAHVGVAFQATDDILGIWGDPAATGKPVFSDLRSRKKTLPVTYAMRRGAAGRRLAAWLGGTDPVVEADLARVAGWVTEAGGRDWALDQARRSMLRAELALGRAVADPVRAELVALSRFIVDREA